MTAPTLPLAPADYSRGHIDSLIRSLNAYFRQLENPGPVVATEIQLTALPTAATGLRSGEVWTDPNFYDVLRLADGTGSASSLTAVAFTAVNYSLTDAVRTLVVTASGKTVTMPAAAVGIVGHEWTVVLSVAGWCDIDCAGADTFIVDPTSATIRLDNKGASVTLRCVSASQWVIV